METSFLHHTNDIHILHLQLICRILTKRLEIKNCDLNWRSTNELGLYFFPHNCLQIILFFLANFPQNYKEITDQSCF